MWRFIAFGFVLATLAPDLTAVEHWNKLRYRGGTVRAKVNPYDYNATLTINADTIEIAFTHSVTVRIKPSQVSGLSYGPEAHKRVGDVVGSSLSATPLALFGLVRAGKEHLIGIVYHTEDGTPAAVLLEADKGISIGILRALKDVTGKPAAMVP